MRLAFVSAFITSAVSLEYYSSQQLNLAREFVKKGHQVTIYTMNLEQNERHEQVLESGSLTLVSLVSLSRLLRDAGLPVLRNIVREVAQGNHEVVIVSGDYHPTPLQVLLSGLPAKRILFQGIYQYSANPLRRMVMKGYDLVFTPMCVRKTDMVIAKTTAAADFMRARGYPHVTSIPVGYAPDYFYPVEEREYHELKYRLGLSTARVMLYVGNLIPRRRVDVQLRALARISKEFSDVRLIVVGEGPEEARLMRLAADLGVRDRVSFVGKQPNRMMRLYYAVSECLLLTSDHEIFGMVLPEALGCGCPLVTTPLPAAHDLVHKENGIIVPFGSHDELAKAMRKILARQVVFDRQAIVESAESLQWGNLASRYLQCFEGLTS